LIPSKSEFPISGSQSYGNYHKALGDSGPGDTGHEMHAKMEEAIEHALAIINGAAKFAEEAQLEQVEISICFRLECLNKRLLTFFRSRFGITRNYFSLIGFTSNFCIINWASLSETDN
jgi:hypothetical protein